MFYTLQPLEWKRYIDDIFSLWSVDKKEIEEFIVLVANSDQRTIKFTAEISDKEINFWIPLYSKAKDLTSKQSLISANFPVHSLLFLPPTRG